MSGKVISHDALTGVTERFHYDAATRKSIIEHIQDVEPFFEVNAANASALDKKNNWWYVGTIPDSVILKWANECRAKPYSRRWRRYAAKQLNKREYRKLNVNNIRLDPGKDRD